jgi:hypothetical protein
MKIKNMILTILAIASIGALASYALLFFYIKSLPLHWNGSNYINKNLEDIRSSFEGEWEDWGAAKGLTVHWNKSGRCLNDWMEMVYNYRGDKNISHVSVGLVCKINGVRIFSKTRKVNSENKISDKIKIWPLEG